MGYTLYLNDQWIPRSMLHLTKTYLIKSQIVLLTHNLWPVFINHLRNPRIHDQQSPMLCYKLKKHISSINQFCIKFVTTQDLQNNDIHFSYIVSCSFFSLERSNVYIIKESTYRKCQQIFCKLFCGGDPYTTTKQELNYCIILFTCIWFKICLIDLLYHNVTYVVISCQDFRPHVCTHVFYKNRPLNHMM